MSCAECRRSKVKCDRIFPCQACVRRGCSYLCPDRALATKRGNQALLDKTRNLNEQIYAARLRVQELECALEARTTGQHPPIQGAQADSQVLTLEDAGSADDGDGDELSEAMGLLSIGAQGQSRYHGETASSSYLQELIDPPVSVPNRDIDRNPRYLEMTSEIIKLINAFPMGLKGHSYNQSLFCRFLPNKGRAAQLIDLYYVNFSWLFDPVVRGDFTQNIFDPIYFSYECGSMDSIHVHQLSIFFLTMAFGALQLEDTYAGSSAFLAQQYYALSRAALSFAPLFQDTNVSTVQALFMSVQFLYLSDVKSSEERWLLTGICIKTSQIVGLHRDGGYWNLASDDIERRRVLFWELYSYEARSSITAGRPPAIDAERADCRFPKDFDAVVDTNGTVQFGFHAWKYRYAAYNMSVSEELVFGTKGSSYRTLLKVDQKLRQWAIPPHLQLPMHESDTDHRWSVDPSTACQQWCALSLIESNLLLIHRSYFLQAIRAKPLGPLSHTFGHSVMAACRSAHRLIFALRGLYAVHPQITRRLWFIWSPTFSACIVLGALVVESPGCALAPQALRGMDEAVSLFEVGSRLCQPRFTKGVLRKLVKRAEYSFTARLDFDRPQTGSTAVNVSAGPDELAILSGQPSVIAQELPFETLDNHQLESLFDPGLPHLPSEIVHDDVPPFSFEFEPALGPSESSCAPLLNGSSHETTQTHDSGQYDKAVQSYHQIPPFFGHPLDILQPEAHETLDAPFYSETDGIATMPGIPFQEEIWQSYMANFLPPADP